jgi:hypothetical protein
MKKLMTEWRQFLKEGESLSNQKQNGKKLAKRAVGNIHKLSQKDKEALKKLQKVLPALVMVAADAPEMNEPLGERRKGMGKRAKQHRKDAYREKILKNARLDPKAEVKNLDSEQKALYNAAKEDLQTDNYMSIRDDGGQASLLLTRIDELPGVRSIPGITGVLTTLFQTDDLTILSAIEALSSITGPLGI